MVGAIQREKSLKKYRRDWKINLINGTIPIGMICTWGLHAVFMGGRAACTPAALSRGPGWSGHDEVKGRFTASSTAGPSRAR
jgi:hypothetical protein